MFEFSFNFKKESKRILKHYLKIHLKCLFSCLYTLKFTIKGFIFTYFLFQASNMKTAVNIECDNYMKEIFKFRIIAHF